MRHSPTPFSVQTIDGGAPTIHDASGRMIAVVRYLGNMPDAVAEHSANAAVFAAAPSMLAALRYERDLQREFIDRGSMPTVEYEARRKYAGELRRSALALCDESAPRRDGGAAAVSRLRDLANTLERYDNVIDVCKGIRAVAAALEAGE